MRFSLLMLTRNRAHYIGEAITAILAQDFDDWELIIKDGSDTPVYSMLPKDPRIKYEYMPHTDYPRVVAAMNEARGDIRNYCADDDALEPGALRCVSQGIRSALWFYGRIVLCDHMLNPGRATMGRPWGEIPLACENFIPFPAAFWTAEAQARVGLFDESLTCADYDYWLRIYAKCGEPAWTDRILARYRMHGDQASCKQAQQVGSDYRMLQERAQRGYYA